MVDRSQSIELLYITFEFVRNHLPDETRFISQYPQPLLSRILQRLGPGSDLLTFGDGDQAVSGSRERKRVSRGI
jgi:hypothetical protein